MINKNMYRLMLLVVCSCILFGCAFTGQNYHASLENVDELNKLQSGSHKINVAPFTASDNIGNSVICRAAGTVATPTGVSFAQYIHDGLVKELKHANLYSEQAPVTLRGNLNDISLSTMIGTGSWEIDMTFDDGKHSPLKIKGQYKFSSNFVAEIACGQAANALEPMVEQFLQKLYRNPRFKTFLK